MRLNHGEDDCALDVAERLRHLELTFSEIGYRLGITKQAAKQLCIRACRKLRRTLDELERCQLDRLTEAICRKPGR